MSDNKIGAEALSAVLKKFLREPLNEKLAGDELKEKDTITISLKKGRGKKQLLIEGSVGKSSEEAIGASTGTGTDAESGDTE